MRSEDYKRIGNAYRNIVNESSKKQISIEEAVKLGERFDQVVSESKALLQSTAEHLDTCLALYKKSYGDGSVHYNRWDLENLVNCLNSIARTHDDLAAKVERMEEADERKSEMYGEENESIPSVYEEKDDKKDKDKDKSSDKSKDGDKDNEDDDDSDDEKDDKKDNGENGNKKSDTDKEDGDSDDEKDDKKGDIKDIKNKKGTAEISKIKEGGLKEKTSELMNAFDNLLGEASKKDQTKGATKPEGLLDKESGKSKEFVNKHTIKKTDEKDVIAQSDSPTKGVNKAKSRNGTDNLDNGDKKPIKNENTMMDKVLGVLRTTNRKV